MKKTFLFLLILVGIMEGACAQKAREEIRQNINLAGSNYVAYRGPQQRLTPSPKGYEPFYISHYGRHGSRYLIGTTDYDKPYEVLLHADSLGRLTPKGRETLAKLKLIREEAAGRDGELTLLGAEQHRAIARRMFNRFPQVFRGATDIDARSTVVIRCILSMENALQELTILNPRLRIRHDASYHDMYYMNDGRAAKHGRSVEAEVRAILDAAVNVPEHNFLLSLYASMAQAGGVELEAPARTDQPRPVDLS